MQNRPYAIGQKGAVFYGSQPYQWIAYSGAGTGQQVPTLSLDTGTGALTVAEMLNSASEYTFFGATVTDGMGAKLCLNVSGYEGVAFTLSGNANGCTVSLQVADAEHTAPVNNTFGQCTDATCIASATTISPMGNLAVKFSQLGGGMPSTAFDPTSVVAIQWVVTPTP